MSFKTELELPAEDGLGQNTLNRYRWYPQTGMAILAVNVHD
jgi:hypothetical protein